MYKNVCWINLFCKFELEVRMSDLNKVTVDKEIELSEIIGHLENISRALKEGDLRFLNRDELVCLRPSQKLAIEVAAKKGNTREGITIRISWKKDKREVLGDEL